MGKGRQPLSYMDHSLHWYKPDFSDGERVVLQGNSGNNGGGGAKKDCLVRGREGGT